MVVPARTVRMRRLTTRNAQCTSLLHSLHVTAKAGPRGSRQSRQRYIAELSSISSPEQVASTTTTQRTLHASSTRLSHSTLAVSPLHTLTYEEYGCPDGIPVLVVHGGPGAGCFQNQT
jgi:hypothetical protein